MSLRRSLKFPITLGVVMIVLLVALTAGWVALVVMGVSAGREWAGLYWTLLSVGSTLFALVLVGVVIYLALSIKAINLTRRQSNFIDSVTHELKSPIASLKLYLQTLNRRQVSQEELQQFYAFMLEDIERLDHLINNVLEAGRLDRPAAREKDIAEVDVPALLRDRAETACQLYRVPADTVQLDLQPCSLRANPSDLELIFGNLLDNAVKYSGEPPEVQVTARVDERGELCVRIRDNGRGIARKDRRKVFGRFVRLGSELERDQPGTGLGLYIVQIHVRRLRGSVKVLDAPSGSGAVMEVKLPGAQQVPQKQEPTTTTPERAEAV